MSVLVRKAERRKTVSYSLRLNIYILRKSPSHPFLLSLLDLGFSNLERNQDPPSSLDFDLVAPFALISNSFINSFVSL